MTKAYTNDPAVRSVRWRPERYQDYQKVRSSVSHGDTRSAGAKTEQVSSAHLCVGSREPASPRFRQIATHSALRACDRPCGRRQTSAGDGRGHRLHKHRLPSAGLQPRARCSGCKYSNHHIVSLSHYLTSSTLSNCYILATYTAHVALQLPWYWGGIPPLQTYIVDS